MRQTTLSLLVLVVALVGAVMFLSTSARPAQADERAATLKALLEEQITAQTPLTLQFATPFIGGETVLTLPDDSGRKLAEVGADYLCVSLPWNDGAKLYCTPFANLVGVNFLK